MRKTIPLNFDWYYRPDFDEGYLKNDYPLDKFEKAMIPHTNKMLPYNDFNEADYQFVSSYKRILTVPESEKGNHLILRFAGVMTVAAVYLNEELLTTHEGGFTPFGVDITDKVRYGEDNHLFVKVDSREIKDIPPFGNVVDYLCYGGIYREVSLLIRPETFIKTVFVKTLESPKLIDAEMVLDLSVFLNRTAEADFRFQIDVSKDGKKIFSDETAGTFKDAMHYAMVMENIERWDLDHPNLYEVQITMFEKERLLDVYSTRFGFRTAEFTVEGFILNNRKIKLVGLDRHQSYPYVGFAMPKRIQEKDADILKTELGCNIVRTSHYMQSDHFINRCDEVGLLVFEEIPGWQYIGNDHFKELTFQNLRDMIITHANHPSIVLWGVRINESPDDDDFYRKTNDIAHELDDSRQTGGVRNFKHSHFFEDVYTYNDFSHTGSNDGLVPPRQVTGRQVPYLVTEHNGHLFPTKKFDPEAKRIEQAMRHLKVLDFNFKHDDSCGAIGWVMNDYNTHVEFGSGDRICYHGVLDMFRIPKYAAAVYASQQKKIPVLTVASTMTMGDHANSSLPPTVLFTNCDYVKVYKNGTFIDTFYSSWDDFRYVPYAPVIVDDYYGSRIKDNEKYPPRVADRIKKALISFQKHGLDLPFADKLRMADLMFFHKMTFSEAERLYGKYIGDWGTKGATYVYEGYLDDVLVKTVTKGSTRQAILKAEPDDVTLEHKDTYDATRIVVRLQDEYGNDLPYAGNVLEVKTTRELQLLGPAKTALIGGSVGVYVRTTGLKGIGTVSIVSEGHPDLKIRIEVK